MPNTCCDLHLHSHYSDGRASPAELVQYAAEIGLSVIALTDHNTLNGINEAQNVARRLGLEVVPGVELDTTWEIPQEGQPAVRLETDLLGYGFDLHHPGFQRFVSEAFNDLLERIAETCHLLTQAGYPVTLADVEKENPRFPGTMYLVTALWQKGYSDSWHGALPLFRDAYKQVNLPKFSISQAINAIHLAGGQAILAHPILHEVNGSMLDGQAIGSLKALGLDGLEVFHPSLDESARKHFRSLANQFDLIVTGGSDEHGWPSGFPRMGSQLVPYGVVQQLRGKARGSSTEQGSHMAG